MRLDQSKVKTCWLLLVFLLLTPPLQALAQDRGIIRVDARTPSGQSKEIELYSSYYALIIGAGAYEKGWPRLRHAVQDTRDVAEILRTMGWEVQLLENPDLNGLDLALTSLITGPGKDRDKAILLWFSGHGHTLAEADGSRLGYIVPVDAPLPSRDETNFMRKAVDMRQIETISRRIASRHVLMVFDSCFSGSIFNLNRAAPSDYIQEKVAEPVREYLTAGNETEKVPDRSVFKTVFIQALEDGYADRNTDGYVTGEELGNYLQEQVINYTRKAQHPQFGKINNPLLDKGDFVFVAGGGGGPPPPPPPETGSLLVWTEPEGATVYVYMWAASARVSPRSRFRG